MNITYTEFTQNQVQELFLSVGWISGRYPQRVHKALMHLETVITAWDRDRLVGLARLIDDSELVAYMHYVVVHPDYHGQGIAGEMMRIVKIQGLPLHRTDAGRTQKRCVLSAARL